MKLFIARHGESEGNRLGLTQGLKDFKLTPEGTEQAKKLASRLKKENIDYVYSSTLKRCRDTTKEVIKFHPHAEVEYINELIEQDKGVFNGQHKSNIHSAIKEYGKPYHLFRPKGGERMIDVYNRIASFYSNKIINKKDENILIIAHGGSISCLLPHLLNEPIENTKRYMPSINTSLSILETKDSGFYTICINDTSHLD